jgi:hypothetical protein
MSATRSQQTTHYQDLLKKLEAKSSVLAECYVGGTSNDEADTLNSNGDYRQPAITRDWDKNNG